MSQLAFNIHGVRFEPLRDIVYRRVRRLEPGGREKPVVVFGDGPSMPLWLEQEQNLEQGGTGTVRFVPRRGCGVSTGWPPTLPARALLGEAPCVS